MWQRFTIQDFRIIGRYLGTLTVFSSFALLIPFMVALAFQEWNAASRYLLATGIFLVLGTSIKTLKVNPKRLTRRDALAVTGLAWIFLSVFSAIPLYLSGHYVSFLDSFFDCVSGFTTTGASLITDVDHLSNADNMFRFLLHYIGGMGLIVVALSLGLFGRSGSSSLYSAEGRSDHVVPNIVKTTRVISVIATSIIFISALVLAVVFMLLGIDPVKSLFEGLWFSISAFMTGGFSPLGDSIVSFHSNTVEIILLLVMLLGSTNFAVYFEVWKGRTDTYFKDIETRTMIIWLSIMSAIMAATLAANKLFNTVPEIVVHGVFMVVSAATTTGFQTVTENQLTTVFSSGTLLLLAMLMAIGGASGSTAGGLKFFRVGIIAKAIVTTLKEALSPDSARVSVTYNHIGKRVVDSNVVKEAMTVFAIMSIVIAAGTLLGIAYGYEATQSIFESAAMAGNAGLTSGIITPGMPIGLEVFYIFQMWAGRLEFVTLLALFAEFIVTLAPRKSISKEIKSLRRRF